LSRFTLSVAQFTLLGNWLIYGNFKQKYKDLINNKPALVLTSLFFLHILGLFYTSDLDYAFKDLRIKLPLLALPVILATSKPIENKKFDILILFYLAAVLIASFIGFGIFLSKSVNDIRNISPFISHIRLSLNICLAIFLAVYFAFTKYRKNLILKVTMIIATIWLLAFLFISESGTGIYILSLTLLSLAFYYIIKNKKIYQKIVVISLLIIIPISLFIYLNYTIKSYLTPHKNDLNNLERLSAQGNHYYQDKVNYPVENGSYVGLYVVESELKEEWNKRSDFDYEGKDIKGQLLKSTLIRYLNSKDLRKDAEGVNQLDEKDIKNIEQGIANYYYTKKFTINSRIYKILWEYQMAKMGQNPGGHSIIQRFEYWKVSLAIIKDNFWFGVGTGDIDNAYMQQYEKMNSILAPEYRHRAHNQFLAFFVTFGIFGLLWFLFTLLYPPIKLKAFSDYRYFVFFVIITLSMLVEDTLETQMGVTLFAFMNSFLLFTSKNKQLTTK